MDELAKKLIEPGEASSAFSMLDAGVVLALSFLLSMGIAQVYRSTHRGTSYSQSFVHTLVLMGMVVAMIMLIIGSNIARAFSLVGALSIIRFRNAVKETRDVGFVFLVMAIGMACGTRFYVLAVFGAAAIVAALLILYKLDVFRKNVTERILRVRIPFGRDYELAFEPVFARYLDDNRLVSIETVNGGALQEVVYSVVLKPKAHSQELIEAVRAVNENQKVLLLIGQENVDL